MSEKLETNPPWLKAFKLAHDTGQTYALGDVGEEPIKVAGDCRGFTVKQHLPSGELLCERAEDCGFVVLGIGDDGTYAWNLKEQ